MQNRVFVISVNGESMMPAKPRNARRLLKDGKAKVVKQAPFTIQLLQETSHYKQEVKIGVDAGQRHIGLAVTSQDNVLWQGEVELRQDVKALLEARRNNRRLRRSNKTRYRKARFLNRKSKYRRADVWLPPSVGQKAAHNVRWVQTLMALVPSPMVRIEVGKFDIQKMKDPTIEGLGYQFGDAYGYENVKNYVLARDNYTCQVCKKKGGKLKVHHILFRHLGGTDRAANLLAVCADCHTGQAHKPGGALYALMQKQVKKSESFAGATFMNVLRRYFFRAFDRSRYPNVSFTYGYITTIERTHLGLSKSHYSDAVAISGIQKVNAQPKSVVLIKQFRKKKRSLHEATPRKGRKEKNKTGKRNAKNTKFSKGIALNDYVQTPSGFRGYVKSYGSNGSRMRVFDLLGNKEEVLWKNLTVLRHTNTWQTQTIPIAAYTFK